MRKLVPDLRFRFLAVYLVLGIFSFRFGFSQEHHPHLNAHSHNDYEQATPLKEAIRNDFNSVEADVYLRNGKLLVSHNNPSVKAPELIKLYLAPLDSLVRTNGGAVYRGEDTPFFLMIDIKSEAASTYEAIRASVAKFPALQCSKGHCPVKIFISGNRPVDIIMNEYSGIAIDGRPADLGKGYSAEMMPVISDIYKSWSSWKGKSDPQDGDLERVRDLAARAHAEGKKLRLWASPDNDLAWGMLIEAGVDLINTDHIPELGKYLTSHGL